MAGELLQGGGGGDPAQGEGDGEGGAGHEVLHVHVAELAQAHRETGPVVDEEDLARSQVR